MSFKPWNKLPNTLMSVKESFKRRLKLENGLLFMSDHVRIDKPYMTICA